MLAKKTPSKMFERVLNTVLIDFNEYYFLDKNKKISPLAVFLTTNAGGALIAKHWHIVNFFLLGTFNSLFNKYICVLLPLITIRGYPIFAKVFGFFDQYMLRLFLL